MSESKWVATERVTFKEIKIGDRYSINETGTVHIKKVEKESIQNLKVWRRVKVK